MLSRQPNDRGFSLVELLIVMAVITVLLAVAIPHFHDVFLNAKETAVMREMHTIHQAQVQYSAQFGKYAASLSELGPPLNGASGPAAANLIPGHLASGGKDGYVFTMTSTSGGFSVHANPETFGQTGRRTFYLDESGVIHQNWSRDPATDGSPEL